MCRRLHGDCLDHNMKVVFKVGDNSATAKLAAGQRTSTARPKPPALTTPRPNYTVNDDNQGRRYLPPSSHHYDFQEDDAAVVQEDLRPGQHESLVKRLRERILLEDAAVTENSGRCAVGSKSTLAVTIGVFLVQLGMHLQVHVH
jgi:hypothetical protein